MSIRSALAAVAVALAASGLAAQTTAPSAAAANEPTASVEPFLRQIAEANSLSDAAAAYAAGCSVDRTSVELNAAYMRRLLQLDQPLAAVVPAGVLVGLGAPDGLAYGVAGYGSGKRNDLRKALTYTIRAAELVKDDLGIQNNLGQLLAWHENAQPFKLTDAEARTAEGLRPEFAQKPAFARAYQAVKEAYEQHARTKSDNEKKLAEAETELKTADTEAVEARDRFQQLTGEVTTQQRNINRDRRRIREERISDAERRRLEAGIIAREVVLREAESRLPAARRQAEETYAKALEKKRARDAARQAANPPPVQVAKLFRWDPPGAREAPAPGTRPSPARVPRPVNP